MSNTTSTSTVRPSSRIEIQECPAGYQYRLRGSQTLHLARRDDVTSPLYDYLRELWHLSVGNIPFNARQEEGLIRQIEAITEAGREPNPAQFAPPPDATSGNAADRAGEEDQAPYQAAPRGAAADGASSNGAPSTESASNGAATEEAATEEAPFYEHDIRAAGPEEEAVVARFIALREKRQEIKRELRALKPQVTALVMEQPDEMKATFEGTRLSVHFRKTYDYSEEVETLSARLKAARSQERASGTATIRKEQAVLRVTL